MYPLGRGVARRSPRLMNRIMFAATSMIGGLSHRLWINLVDRTAPVTQRSLHLGPDRDVPWIGVAATGSIHRVDLCLYPAELPASSIQLLVK
eukprot:3643302-Prymnesium_polylepis.1